MGDKKRNIGLIFTGAFLLGVVVAALLSVAGIALWQHSFYDWMTGVVALSMVGFLIASAVLIMGFGG